MTKLAKDFGGGKNPIAVGQAILRVARVPGGGYALCLLLKGIPLVGGFAAFSDVATFPPTVSVNIQNQLSNLGFPCPPPG